MNKRICILIIILFYSITLSAIYIEQVNIESEFYGPFSKNKVEILIHNDSSDDKPKEGFINFHLNESAFVKQLWLEINGELKPGETFYKIKSPQSREDANDKLYKPKEIQNSALLTKSQPGSYKLSVYPINKNESRRVIIEYYSILETESDTLTWTFKLKNNKIFPEDVPINLKAKFQLPNNTKIMDNNHNLLTDKKCAELEEKNEISLKFSFPYDTLPSNIIKSTNSKLPKVNYTKLDDTPYLIEDLIKNYKLNSYIIPNYSNEDNIFLSKFFDYLFSVNSSDDFYYEEFGNWATKKDSIFYFDPNLQLNLSKRDFSKMFGNQVECPFIDEFITYLGCVNNLHNKPIAHGYLTGNTGILVFEDNPEVLNIIKKYRAEGFIEDEYYIPVKRDANEGFFIMDSAPIIMNLNDPRLEVKQSLYQTLKMFELNKSVVMRVEVSKRGNTENLWIVRSGNDVVDIFALDRTRFYQFYPAFYNAETIRCIVTFGVNYEYKDVKEPEYPNFFGIFNRSKHFEIENRSYNRNKSMIYEDDFSFEKSDVMQLFSPEFFEYLLRNPDTALPLYIFSLQNNYHEIGLRDKDGKCALITKARE
jgi:hypothetical protein